MCEKWKTIVLELPENIDPEKTNRSISCDGCCVNLMMHLWSHNIQTRGHCCGHYEKYPSIVVADGYTEHDIEWIENLIKKVDDRQWFIFQWKLVKVN